MAGAFPPLPGLTLPSSRCFQSSTMPADGATGGIPDHGPRAAALAWRLRELTGLDDGQLSELVGACDSHTVGPEEDADITVLTCLDADRLDIPRVGMRIRPDLLLTGAGRSPEMLSWAGERAASRTLPAICADEWDWRP